MKKVLAVLIVVFLASGCSTVTSFNLPENSKVRIYERERLYESNEKVKMRPFFWTASGGIKYEVIREGEVIESGRLSSKFRVVTIFWPPFSSIYWPLKFRYKNYDLTAEDSTMRTINVVK